MNQHLKGYRAEQGIEADAWREEYVPFGYSNVQTLINEIRDFANQPGGLPMVNLRVVGNSIPDFFREYVMQGVRAFDVPAVCDASAGLTFACPSGYEISMTGEINYVKRGVFIRSLNESQGFDILWQSPDTPEPVPFSPYMNT